MASNDKVNKKVALVVIDMSQEQFQHKSPLIPNNILSLAKALHSSGGGVFDSRLWMSPHDTSSLHHLYPDIGIADTPGAKLTSELESLADISTFVEKVQYSAFFGSKLNSLLQAKGINAIALTGINTDYCVFSTALDAFYLGYQVWLIQDACASIVSGDGGHRQGIADFKRFLGRMGKVMETKDALKKLQHLNHH